MHKYLFGLDALKTMMHMFLDKLDRGARAVDRDAMETRVKFEADVTTEHTNAIKDYQSCHQYVIVDQHENDEELDFHGCLIQSDV